jgi:hypothetical protein
MEHLFINNKVVATAKGLKSLKLKVKEDFENPKKDIKCFIISLGLHPDYKFPLTINCSQHTITPKLGLFAREDDMSQTITYSEKELENIGFKLSHLKKIMKVIKKDLISFEKNSVPITEVINLLEK